MSESEGFFDPPPTDRELNAEIVRVVVHDQFPELAVQSVEYLASGWSRDAYLVDDHVVFRFPRYADAGRDLDVEDRQLRLVRSAVGVLFGVPTITFWGKPSARFPHPFVGHEFIRGVQAYDPHAPRPPELADDIGLALTRIHSIPVSLADGIGVGSSITPSCQELFDQMRQLMPVVPKLKDVAPPAWSWMNAGPRVPRSYGGPPRFIHADLSPAHIIVSPSTGRLSGIIDWGPALGDPAEDFSYLVLCRSPSFLQRALDAYELPVDPELVERAIFLGRIRALAWLLDAVKRGGEPDGMLQAVRGAFAD